MEASQYLYLPKNCYGLSNRLLTGPSPRVASVGSN